MTEKSDQDELDLIMSPLRYRDAAHSEHSRAEELFGMLAISIQIISMFKVKRCFCHVNEYPPYVKKHSSRCEKVNQLLARIWGDEWFSNLTFRKVYNKKYI